jgi:hypothetical protein
VPTTQRLESLETDAPLVRTGYVGTIRKPSRSRGKRNSRNRGGAQDGHDTADVAEPNQTADLLSSSPPSSSSWRLPHVCLACRPWCTPSLCGVDATDRRTRDVQALGSLGKVLPALPWTPSKVWRPLFSLAPLVFACSVCNSCADLSDRRPLRPQQVRPHSVLTAHHSVLTAPFVQTSHPPAHATEPPTPVPAPPQQAPPPKADAAASPPGEMPAISSQ